MASERGSSRVGTMFGPYEIRSLLGAGGMGEVYQAYDTSKGRIVALKLLRPELAAHNGFQERFRRESRVAARLQEPHVIPVHDWGEINGVLYIDMRLVDGSDLHAVLRRNGPLEPARAASIIAQVAEALDAAHAAGLIHRDVKPENVLLTASNFAYLVDFGIAHLGGESGITSAGSAIGSFAYMAPERFTGGPIGPQTDVYSLGVRALRMPHRSTAFSARRRHPDDGLPSHAAATSAKRRATRVEPRVRPRHRPRNEEAPGVAIHLGR